ncbi:MAG: tetratricopeptide repeat protein, partial [Verrucomicrobiales bacterium]|nr:tetratricopeptide repeat protein [Verrucomicrobiales bacterium]
MYTCLGFACLPSSGRLGAKQGDALEDFAEVYIDQYFEPDEDLLLSEAGKQKSRALAYYSRGRTFEGNGRMNEAIVAYKEVLAAQPDQHFLARKTAYLMARAGRNDEALKLLVDNLEANSEVPFPYIALSEYLATYQGNSPTGRARALDIIEDAARKFPNEPAVYDHLVRLLIAGNRRDDAKVVMEQAAARDNKDPKYWLAIGKIVGRAWPPRPNGPSKNSELVNQIYAKALSLAGE